MKLFSSILDSSVWEYDAETRLVWITLLAMADSTGRVHAAIPGIANRARVSVAKTEEALAIFQQPDKYSRTPDNEGRRIRQEGRDWLILNFESHRQRQSREMELKRKREWWRKNKSKEALDAKLDEHDASLGKSRRIAEADTDTDTEADVDRRSIVRKSPTKKVKKKKTTYPDDFEKFWLAYPKKSRVKKKAALKAWKNSEPDRPSVEALISALKNQEKSRSWMDGYIPHPTTWLNDARWFDEIDNTQQRPQQHEKLTAVEQSMQRSHEAINAWREKEMEKHGYTKNSVDGRNLENIIDIGGIVPGEIPD